MKRQDKFMIGGIFVGTLVVYLVIAITDLYSEGQINILGFFIYWDLIIAFILIRFWKRWRK